MKQCPACKTTYTDETLRFCLADGSALTALGDEQATFVRPAGEQMRVEIPHDAPPPSQFQPVSQPSQSSGSGLKILLAVVGLGLLILVILGVAGGIYYFSTGEKGTVANSGSPSPNKTASPIASPSPKDETADLKNQIANLERMINEQKNQNRAVNAPPSTVPNPNNIGTTARVNSPGDGFLALRSFPSSETGTRILKIPHGATVSIGGCLNRVGNKGGRWCRASYNGYSGWVNDGWLIY